LTLDLARLAAQAASAKTLEPTAVLEVGEIIGITDYFVITAGRNDRQVRAIVEEVEVQLKAAGARVVRPPEGRDDLAWVLMDYGDFVVHVFSTEARAFYDLERLWRDAVPVEFVTVAAPSGGST
jgi:ribosome-associated protein